MSRLLDMIPKRGPEAYEKFMEILKTDYPWIVENFRDREEDMKAKGIGTILPVHEPNSSEINAYQKTNKSDINHYSEMI